MNCKKPHIVHAQAFPCGRCMPCLVRKKREWTHRLMLERSLHTDACMVTLTYSDEHLPPGGTVDPAHLRGFLNRLRDYIYPVRFRYFGVGEYGTKSMRPHYHIALFGLPMTEHQLYFDRWGKGGIHVGDLSPESAGYICGYVTKKMTKKDDSRLEGRHPEFTRMSLKPGIGAGAMAAVGSALQPHKEMIHAEGDVPGVLNHGRRTLPLGRYLKSKLREELDLPAQGCVSKTELAHQEAMLALRKDVGRIAFEVAKPFVDWDKVVQTEERALRPRKEKL